MDNRNDDLLYNSVDTAVTELLIIAERYDTIQNLDPEHVQRRLPVLMEPILQLLHKAGNVSIYFATIGQLPENRVASNVQVFGHFINQLASTAAQRMVASLSKWFANASKTNGPPVREDANSVTVFPADIQEFISSVAAHHPGISNLVQLIIKYEMLSPPIGNSGVFGRMSSAEVVTNPHVPKRPTSELPPWTTADLPMGFFSMAPRDHHHVSSSAYCQWIKEDPFLDSATGLHLGGVNGARWALRKWLNNPTP